MKRSRSNLELGDDVPIPMMDWDDVVDVVCVGSGGGLIAAGLTAARAGCDVYVATVPSAPRRDGGCGRPWGSDLSSRLGVDDVNDETVGHLNQAVEEFAPVVCADDDFDLPVRILEDRQPPSGTVEPFRGAQLGTWARRCATSPNGVLFNRVTHRQMSEARAAGGVALEVAVIGSFGAGHASVSSGLTAWLYEQASSAGVEIDTVERLERLVFEDGHLVGVIVGTAEGRRAVRALHDVIIGTGELRSEDAPLNEPNGLPSDMRLCLVSQFASKFARLELVSSPVALVEVGQQSRPRVSANEASGYARRR